MRNDTVCIPIDYCPVFGAITIRHCLDLAGNFSSLYSRFVVLSLSRLHGSWILALLIIGVAAISTSTAATPTLTPVSASDDNPDAGSPPPSSLGSFFLLPMTRRS